MEKLVFAELRKVNVKVIATGEKNVDDTSLTNLVRLGLNE